MKTMVRGKGVERSVLVSDLVSMGGWPRAATPRRTAPRLSSIPTTGSSSSGPPSWPAPRPAAGLRRQRVRHAGLTLPEAVRLVTANPSRLLGLPAEAGHETLRVGVAANLTVFRPSETAGDIEVLRTIVEGAVVHDTA